MSINQTIKVKDEHRQYEDPKDTDSVDATDTPSIDQSAETSDKGDLEQGTYEGRKHQPDIDGPQQASQETDDVYDEGREDDTRLPPAGKNVGELNAFDLGRHDED